MKTVPLQLITVDLDNGRRGIFIGGPFITEETEDDHQIKEIWFSNVQEVPDNLTVAELVQLVRDQAYDGHTNLQ